MRRLDIAHDDETADAHESTNAGRGAFEQDDIHSIAEEFHELQREAAQLHEQLSVSTGGVGEDGSGSVQVSVGADGRVYDVQIARSWKRLIDPDNFDTAVLEALTNAVMARMGNWAEATTDSEHGSSAPSEADSSAQRLPPTPERPSDSHERRTFRQETSSLLDGVEDELDALDERVGQATQNQIEGRSPSHQVIASVTAWGQITGITTRPRLLQKSSPAALSQEVLAALRDAYERAETESADSLLGDGNLARIQELLNDQAALARRFGLDT